MNGHVPGIAGTRLRTGETAVEQAEVVLGDFVPTRDYHARVAGAALVYAAGGEPWLGVEPEEDDW
jgi:hypothetical protein